MINKKKIILTIILLLLVVGILEYNAMRTRTLNYKATYRGISCWGKELVIKNTACCHSQCDKATDWPTKDTPPKSCISLWKAALN